MVEKGGREPYAHIEFKRKSAGDRYLGLRIDQLETISEMSGRYAIVYASLNIDPPSDNARIDDIVGMFLKKHSHSDFFKPFSELRGTVKLEYVLTGENCSLRQDV